VHDYQVELGEPRCPCTLEFQLIGHGATRRGPLVTVDIDSTVVDRARNDPVVDLDEL
jgi:hypothetical protein